MIKDYNWEGTHRFDLDNGIVRLSLLSYGARINNLVFDGKDLVLGYDTMDDIRRSVFYTNPIVGRFANRIADGRFSLNGTEHQLDKNEKGCTHLHGGSDGFDKKEWEWKILSENAVRFHRISPHLEMGYPGNLSIDVTYTLSGSSVVIGYRATCDRDTVLNLTNHAYFNLDGHNGTDCRSMMMKLEAPYYLPVDDKLIPTGNPEKVDGTIFDFRESRPIKEEYDHCFVFDGYGSPRKVCELFSHSSGINLAITTDLPGMQLYTGTYLNDSAGKDGIPIHPHQAIVLEPQFLPDSPNHSDYPPTVLKAGDVFSSESKYEFSKK